jgi:N-acetylglucosaminyl-diphospho-decaprenol L-rhamnosyltransferase
VLQSNIRPVTQQEATPGTIDVSVIIVSWNVRELLLRCVQTLLSPEVRGDLSLEIIVVDNASDDGSLEALKAFPCLRVIRNTSNLGYGKGNNIGFVASQGRYLLVLNPDAHPLPGSLQALIRFAEAVPKAGIVAPRLLNPDGSVQPGAFHFPTLAMAALDLFPIPHFVPGRIRAWLWNSGLNGRYRNEALRTQPFRVDHPLGASMLIRLEAYREVGGFDCSIFMYAEEIDLALRYAKVGWECWQVPSAQTVHLGGQSTRQMPDRMIVELWRSRLYIYDKHYSQAARLGLRLLLVATQVAKAIAALVRLLAGRTTRGEAMRAWQRSARLARLALR